MASRYIEDDNGNMIPNPDYVDAEANPDDQPALDRQSAGWLPLQGWTSSQVPWQYTSGAGGIQHADEKSYLEWLYGPGGTYDYSGEQGYYRPAGGMGSFLPGRTPLQINPPDSALGNLVLGGLTSLATGALFSELLPGMSEMFSGADAGINTGGLDGALGDAGSSWGNLFETGGSGFTDAASAGTGLYDNILGSVEDLESLGGLDVSGGMGEQVMNNIPTASDITGGVGDVINAGGLDASGGMAEAVMSNVPPAQYGLQDLLKTIFGTSGTTGAAQQAGQVSPATALLNYFLQQNSAGNLMDQAQNAASMSNPLNDPKRQPYQQMFMELMTNPSSFYSTNPVVKAQLELAKNQFIANSAKMGVGGKQFNDYLTNVQNVAAGTFKDQANILSGAGGFGFPGGNNGSAYMTGANAANTARNESYRGFGNIAQQVFNSDMFKNATSKMFDFSLG